MLRGGNITIKKDLAACESKNAALEEEKQHLQRQLATEEQRINNMEQDETRLREQLALEEIRINVLEQDKRRLREQLATKGKRNAALEQDKGRLKRFHLENNNRRDVGLEQDVVQYSIDKLILQEERIKALEQEAQRFPDTSILDAKINALEKEVQQITRERDQALKDQRIAEKRELYLSRTVDDLLEELNGAKDRSVQLRR